MTNITLNFLDAAVVALDNAVEALASTAGGRRGDYDTDEEAPAEYAALWVAHGAAHAALSAWKAANEDRPPPRPLNPAWIIPAGSRR